MLIETRCWFLPKESGLRVQGRVTFCAGCSEKCFFVCGWGVKFALSTYRRCIPSLTTQGWWRIWFCHPKLVWTLDTGHCPGYKVGDKNIFLSIRCEQKPWAYILGQHWTWGDASRVSPVIWSSLAFAWVFSFLIYAKNFTVVLWESSPFCLPTSLSLPEIRVY